MYQLVLSNGTIVDGNRNKPFTGWIGINGNRIIKISKEPLEGTKTVDCTGKIISPGFIDLHTHSDATPLNSAKTESYINQGVTTQIGGNCGISMFPSNAQWREGIDTFYQSTLQLHRDDLSIPLDSLDDYVAAVGDKKLSTNIGLLVGHGTLRAAAMGLDDRDPTSEEMDRMKDLLRNEMKQGAYGMSLGLIYPPSNYGKPPELIELSKVVKEYNGILSVHMRNEGEHVFQSVEEMLHIAHESGVHLHISHLKLMGKNQWRRASELISLIKEAIAKGAVVTCDQYPYVASSTGLSALVPPWAHDGGKDKMVVRLKEGSTKLLQEILDEMTRRGGPHSVEISSTHGYASQYDGKKMDIIAETMNTTPEQAVANLLIATQGSASAVYFAMAEEDVLTIMREDFIAIGSDGYDFSYNLTNNPHPRSFGTFPRFFQLVREHNLMSIEDAVYKTTGLPGGIIHLEERGILKEGNIADITVFDFAAITDNSTFANSPVPPSGIEHVFIQGIHAFANGKQTQDKAGVISLRK